MTMHPPEEQSGALDTVLGGLRSAEVPAGLADEVVRRVRMELAAATPQRRGVHWPMLPLPVAALAAAVCAGVFALWPNPRATHAPAAHNAGPKEARNEAVERTPLAVQQSKTASPNRNRPAQVVVVRPSAAAMHALPRHTAAATPAGQQPELARLPASGLAAKLRNVPAPAAPLSEQERLLLRVARDGDPAQLAMLNSDLQAALDQARRDEFLKLSNGGSR